MLTVADNTGARKIMCIRVLGGNRKYAKIGDSIIGVVKEAIPNMPIKKSDIVKAIIVRTAKSIRRQDGMYISFDDGAKWQPFQLNLPIVSIRDLHMRDNNLIAATHGRSFWIIDDLTPLHQLNKAMSDKPFYLYKPKDSYRINQGGRGRANTKLVGENHPNGVIFNYYINI